jgi:ribosomal-protein-alanine N-acetyltransferase
MSNQSQQGRIRRMTAADLDRVIEMAAALEHAPHWPRSAYVVALDPDAVPRRVALVAAEAEPDGVAGFAIASLIPPQAELESIAVTAASQRRGVARRLFAALLAEFEPHGITEVILEVRASNQPALELYSSIGFTETARRPRYYVDPVEDAILLALRIG